MCFTKKVVLSLFVSPVSNQLSRRKVARYGSHSPRGYEERFDFVSLSLSLSILIYLLSPTPDSPRGTIVDGGFGDKFPFFHWRLLFPLSRGLVVGGRTGAGRWMMEKGRRWKEREEQKMVLSLFFFLEARV